jgi:hypothetical protein
VTVLVSVAAGAVDVDVVVAAVAVRVVAVVLGVDVAPCTALRAALATWLVSPLPQPLARALAAQIPTVATSRRIQ